MKKPFEVGDRVAVYDGGKRKTGKVSAVDEMFGTLGVDYDLPDRRCFVHPKQCRRLVKRERRRALLSMSKDGEWSVDAFTGEFPKPGVQIHLVEVKARRK